MNECIFCKIVAGEIPSMKIYEDDLTLAFLDVAKDVDGHILVIPKKHCKNILDCDAEDLHAVMQTVKKVSLHLTENCGYDGVNLLNASDESAGQSVPHFHIHIIPRKQEDGIDAWPGFTGAQEELEVMFRKLKMPSAIVKPMIIRPMESSEYPLLKTFLYEALFVPEGAEPFPKDIIYKPELVIYYKDFGTGRADRCLVAEDDGKVVGAAWTRLMHDYGYVDDETPSFAISLLPEYRGQGIGTQLLKGMLDLMKSEGYAQVSLSVQKANKAVNMYVKAGFQPVWEDDEEYVMVCRL